MGPEEVLRGGTGEVKRTLKLTKRNIPLKDN